jgi:hypothetical protein
MPFCKWAPCSQSILNAAVGGEIVGRARGAPTSKIARRADDSELCRPCDLDRDHVGCRPTLRSDRGIETGSDEIHLAQVNPHVELHFRIGRQKALPDRHDNDGCAQGSCPDSQPPHGPSPFLVQFLKSAGDLIERRPQLFEQAKTGVGQRHASCRAVEQSYPESRLKLPYRVAHSRRGKLQSFGGRAKTQVLGHEKEGVQVREGAPLH